MNARSRSSADKDQDHSAAAASKQKIGGGGSAAGRSSSGTGNSSFPAMFSPTSSMSWLRLKDPRIVCASRAFGGNDRHSKVCTVRGLRDRRVRLSVPTAIQLYDLQDRLGLSQPSKVVDWLLNAAKDHVDELPPLEIPPAEFIRTSLLSLNKVAAAAGINRSSYNIVSTSSASSREDHGFPEMSNNLMWGDTMPQQLQQDQQRKMIMVGDHDQEKEKVQLQQDQRRMMIMVGDHPEKEKVQLQHSLSTGGNFLVANNNSIPMTSQMNYQHGTTTTIFQYPLEPSICTQLSASQLLLLAQASGGGDGHASSCTPLPMPFSQCPSSGSHHGSKA